MGKRGPPKTPTIALQSRGSWLAKGRKDEPIAREDEPTMPADLDSVAAGKWNELSEDLRARRMLSVTYSDAMAMYCRTWSEYMQADEQVKVQGLTIIGAKGGVIQNPLVLIRKNARADLLRIGQQFGFTPSSKAGIVVDNKPKVNDGKGRFFKKTAS